MTSNNERDFPPPFLRRCLRLDMSAPKEITELSEIVSAHFLEPEVLQKAEALIAEFSRTQKSQKGLLAIDQLLNVIHLVTREPPPTEREQETLRKRLLRFLDSNEGA